MTETPLTQAIDASLARIAAQAPGPARLEAQLRQLAKWRSIVLANTLAARGGTRITHGPFAGMTYPVDASEGARAPRLLGAYEASLHPVIEAVIARAYPQVLDIGCAEGYYAVGLARQMPGTTVHARDSDPRARALCANLAQVNEVSDRLQIGPEVTYADLALCDQAPTFVLCDIEGAEDALLDPARAPALAHADLLVEVHGPAIRARLTDRFAATHRITRIDRTLRPDLLPDWAEGLSDLDRLLLLWEWRAMPTPWLWMEHR
ncbi:class I SAM-dependent methyltransferase [Tabrizicola aquatica]|uniref:class I SAM-dependent methyltransferase n=1 Tax=Tabrizicola aquatica TaxID=909926 RepID=UPI000CD0185D|nr:class I SAM-dependent methyltransferase [Tabrizicola aquatica]